MKFRTILALFVVVLAVFLRGGHAEETEESDDFEEKYLGYGAQKVEDSEPYVFVFLIYKTNNDLFKRSVQYSFRLKTAHKIFNLPIFNYFEVSG